MPTIEIPVSLYSTRKRKPTNRYGAPAQVPVRAAEARAYARFAFDRIPADAIIGSVIFRVFGDRPHSGPTPLTLRDVTEEWSSRIKWSKSPSVGDVVQSIAPTNTPDQYAFDFDVSLWAVNRPKNGLRIETSAGDNIWLVGSSAGSLKPMVIATYSVPADQPTQLVPDGGWVSTPNPILTYVGDSSATQQKIDFSIDNGTTVSYTTGWMPIGQKRFTPTAASPVLVQGAMIHWRVTTQGPNGTKTSEWAWYGYEPIANPTLISPGETTSDGSPPVEWEHPDQVSVKADLHSAGLPSVGTGWQLTDDKFWVPNGRVPVPNGTGRIEIRVKDSVTPRVEAPGAWTFGYLSHTFRTTLVGSGTPVDDPLVLDYDEPVVTISGSRAAGTPDEVSLFRDNVQVTIWDDEGNPYGWAPGPLFFDGTSFSIKDYTADLHHEHVWEVRVRVNGVLSAQGPTVTQRLHTRSVWLVNPESDERVEIIGLNGVPVVDQTTEEASILHQPLNGGLLVEPKRRRMMRTTKMGSVTGGVLNEDSDILDSWALADSATKYRLIFGRVNWSVILGDLDPTESLSHLDRCGPEHVAVKMNWWQRLGDY